MKIHPVLAANSAIPGSSPPPAPKAATLAGWDERRHSASPPNPSRPQTQAACSGRPGKGGESALVSGGGAGRGARPSLLWPARWTEGSKGQENSPQPAGTGHREVPAWVPVVEPGARVQEGQKVTRGPPESQIFPFYFAGGVHV